MRINYLPDDREPKTRAARATFVNLLTTLG